MESYDSNQYNNNDCTRGRSRREERGSNYNQQRMHGVQSVPPQLRYDNNRRNNGRQSRWGPRSDNNPPPKHKVLLQGDKKHGAETTINNKIIEGMIIDGTIVGRRDRDSMYNNKNVVIGTIVHHGNDIDRTTSIKINKANIIKTVAQLVNFHHRIVIGIKTMI